MWGFCALGRWYAKYRLPDGRQVQKRIGPAWTSRGRPLAGYFTKRTAEDWLRGVLDQARAGTLPGLIRTGVTFAEEAEEYLTWLEFDRERKPSTLRDYHSMIRTHMLPTFGDAVLEDITPEQIERSRRSFGSLQTYLGSTRPRSVESGADRRIPPPRPLARSRARWPSTSN